MLKNSNMNEVPMVSVVTATYNDKDNLKMILEHVAAQDYPDIEHIVVDGASKDGSKELLEGWISPPNVTLKWISEPDHGIYDALNKGIRMARGGIIGCCYDEYAGTDVVSKMVDAILREDTDGVHGDLCYMDGGKVVRYWHQGGGGSLKTGWMPGHPTLYLKREVYEKYGGYRTDYRISADYEFMIRILKDRKVKLSYIPEVLVYMSHGGTSTSGISSYLAGMKEGHRALKENGFHFIFLTDICRTARVLAQFIKKR